MSRIDDILVRARDSLADHAKQRWTDDRLLRLVDEAQKDIARHSKLLKGTFDISLSIDVHTYELPEDMFLITRASFDDCEITLVSYDSMDEQAKKDVLNRERYDVTERRLGRGFTDLSTSACWELDSAGYVDRLIYDNRNMGEIRVYPTPDESIAFNDYTFQQAGYLDPTLYATDSPFGVLTDVATPDTLIDALGVTVDADSITYLITDPDSCNGAELVDDIGFSSPYGLVAEITDNIASVAFHGDEQLGVAVSIDGYNADSIYGVVTDMYDPDINDEEFKTVFGVLTGVNESIGLVRIWYIKLPKTLTDVKDDLELPTMYDTAIRLYVVGNAFLDDNDAAYRQKGTDTLTMYDRELNLAQTTSSQDGARNPAALTTSYRGPFE